MSKNSGISKNSVKHKHAVLNVKSFLFLAIPFSQAVLIQLFQFSISTDFVYTQLNVKNSSILKKSFLCKYSFNVKKHFK